MKADHKVSGEARSAEPNVATHPAYGFRQLDPKPEPDFLEAYYESKYYDPLRKSASGTTVAEVVAATEERQSVADRDWRRASEHVDIAHYMLSLAPGRRVLDIGAGIGEVVASLNGYGLEASGIDPSREASFTAQAQGIDVTVNDIAGACKDAANRESFDGALLMNVLEHVPAPEEALRQVRTLLKPGGILMVRVPNDFSVVQSAFVGATGAPRWWIASPDHVSYFNHESLAKFLHGEGFRVEVSTCDFPIDWFLLMGRNYIEEPQLGAEAHRMRRSFETMLPGEDRRRIYEALAQAGCGRNVIVYARKVEAGD